MAPHHREIKDRQMYKGLLWFVGAVIAITVVTGVAGVIGVNRATVLDRPATTPTVVHVEP